MCKAFMDMKLEGIEEGMEKGKVLYLVEVICKKLQKNKSAETIAGELEEDLSAVENIIGIQRRVGNYDAKQIYDAMQRELTE